MKGFIYIIRNTVNSKVYIGQTRVSVQNRWKEHLRHAKYGDQIINKAMRKYGTDKFYIETLEICDDSIIDEREIYYIDLFDSTNKSKGYNVSLGGQTPKFKRKVLELSTLIDLYQNKNLSLSDIALKFNVTRYIITTELRRAGIRIKSKKETSIKFDKIDRNRIVESLDKKGSLRSAAKYCNIPYPTFRKACLYYNIEYNSSKSAQHL